MKLPAGPRPAYRLLATGLTLILGSAVLGFLAGAAVRSPAQVLADAAPPKPTVLTEAVTSGRASRSVAFDGKVEYEFVTSIAAPAVVGDSTSAIVTRLPLRTGSTIRGGDLAAEVSGRPVLVLQGRLPSFRALSPGATGTDVAQLQEGLRVSGAVITDNDGTYGSSTAAAVASLYRRHGYTAIEVGQEEVAAGELAVRDAERAVAQLGPEADKFTRRYTFEDLDQARANLDEAQRLAGAQVPVGEIVFVPALPARVSSIDGALGGNADGSLLTVAAGRLVVRGAPIGGDRDRIVRGADVELLLTPGGRVPGSVTSVTARPASVVVDGVSGGEGSVEATRIVTVAADKKLAPKMVGRPTRVVVTVERSKRPGLIVPISAITSAADGTTAVTVIRDGGHHRVEVIPGFVGDGIVQVVPRGGDGLEEGDRVAIGLGG